MGRLVVDGVGKAYKRYPGKWARLREWLTGHPHHEKTWVLRDVSFRVEPGEAVGIVGVNGAGKSTLLKIITGTTEPTTGGVTVQGRVAALLELGMGFHPDFTGRQNALIAGQLLGYRVDEIATVMDEIEAFADIGEYFDRPVRIYSSGMQVRLAFSVATAIRPDILIVDEALAVGDRFFSQKSFDRIKGFLDSGTTLLFVSHDGSAVKTLCDRALLLEGGTLAAIGKPEAIIDRYSGSILSRVNESLSTKATGAAVAAARTEKGHAEISHPRQIEGFSAMRAQVDSGELCLADFQMVDIGGAPVIAINSGDEIVVRYSLRAERVLRNLFFGVALRNNLAVSVFNTNTAVLGKDPVDLEAGQRANVVFRMKVPLVPGFYGICIGAAAGYAGGGFFDKYHLNLINVSVLEVHAPRGGLRFGGIVDLAPDCYVGMS